MKKALIILGPTATGKTDIGLSLAKKINGELVSCDSRQVYTGLDIGTGKMPGKNVSVKKEKGYWEMDGIRIWMYDVADPIYQYTVFDYMYGVEDVLQQIEKKDKIPIFVGGTGFYLKALLEGIENMQIPLDKELRNKLTSLSVPELQKRVEALSPTALEEMNHSDRSNSRRLIRKIEILAMYPYIPKPSNVNIVLHDYNVLKIGLLSPRSVLRTRIDSRLKSRIDAGMIEESKKLLERGVSLQRMEELGLEYRYLALLLEGKLTEEEFFTQLSQKISQYAKRQMTWFKKEKDVTWFDITDDRYAEKVEKLALDWYNSKD